MKNYYFTFGSSPNYPFQNGWVMIQAPSRTAAIQIYNAYYPPKTRGLVNCAFIYEEEEFKRVKNLIGRDIAGAGCHRIIGPMTLTPEKEPEEQRKQKIFISGKITGDPNYREKFEKAEKELTAQGYLVMNPAVFPEGFTWEEYMKITLTMLSVCDIIYLLPDWNESRGAQEEFEYATRRRLKIILEPKKALNRNND